MREVTVNDTAINPAWDWVKTMNPDGISNSNHFNAFDSSVGIKIGAVLTVVAVDDDSLLVSYSSPNGIQTGTEAANGTLFFLKASDFVQMTAAYQSARTEQQKRKDLVKALLEKGRK